jgi:hypothetical protein
MPPLYKEAVFWLILLAVTTALTAIAYVVLMPLIGPIRAQAAFGFFGLLGLGGFSPLFYRKRGRTVVLDERDEQIAKTALVAGYSVFWLFFVSANMGVWSVVYFGGHSTISVHVLPDIVFGGFVIFITTRAVAIVVQYRRQDADKGE